MSNESLPEHLQKPHLRPVQPLPVQKDGKQFIALRDPTMMSQSTMIVPQPVVRVVQMFRGEFTLDELAERASTTTDQLDALVRRLDELGLLWGPTFEAMERERWAELEKAGRFPPRATLAIVEKGDTLEELINGYFEQVEDPELERQPRGILAPHLDYERGWPNYAAAYYGWREQPKPDRVVVFAANHFGLGDGVVMTDLGIETPLGVCPPDAAIIGAMKDAHGKAIVVDQLDHMPEHSIELQIPWIQKCFGVDVPVVPVLLPDPLQGMIEEDDERVSIDRFVETFSRVLESAGGETRFVIAADLSHAGPQFGEPRDVDEKRKHDVETLDRELLGKVIDRNADEFLEAMKWNRNPTRWDGVGSIMAALQVFKPEEIELLDYRQASDPNGKVLVSSAALAWY